MEKATLNSEVCTLVGNHLLRDDITPNHKFADLDCDQLDLIAISMLADEKYDVSLPLDPNYETVADLIARIEQELNQGAA